MSMEIYGFDLTENQQDILCETKEEFERMLIADRSPQ